MATKFTISQEQGVYLDCDKAYLPHIPGIYVVYSCDYDSSSGIAEIKDVLYIGETQNVNERHNGTPDHPKQHEHYEDFVRKAGGVEHVCYGIVPMEDYSDDTRVWIQDAMIFRQKPQINSGPEKYHYNHPAIDLTLQNFPNCWKTFHIFMPYDYGDEVGL
ncbi:MAG: hypothetical protein K2I08_00455 [Muribaculaceae bacterium]|nr:hypothetical protein [Muribaculaceae bacterium]MDE6523357.1 hypothetical protein [Muribaculaceae bacterium]